MIRRLLAAALVAVAEWSLLIAPTQAAINAPVVPAQAPFAIQRTGDAGIGTMRFAPIGTTEVSGGYFSPSCAWAPTQSGTYIAQTPSLHSLGISGASPAAGSQCGTGGTPDSTSSANGVSQMVMQVVGNSTNQAQLGIFVDLDDYAGLGGLAGNQDTQHVGAQISALRRSNTSAAPNGPGSLWGLNLDIGDSSTFPGFMVGEELDLHYNNAACSPLGTKPNGCFNNATWHSYLTAFPGLADIFVNTQGQAITAGTVNIAADGVTITQASLTQGGACGSSGTCANGATPTTLGFSADTSVVTLNGVDWRVTPGSVISQTQLVVTPHPDGSTPGQGSNVPINWSSHAAQYAHFVSDSVLGNGPSGAQVTNAVIREVDLFYSDRARVVLQAQGFHDQGINFAADAGMRYAALFPKLSKVCVNGASQCFSSDGTETNFDGSISIPQGSFLDLNGSARNVRLGFSSGVFALNTSVAGGNVFTVDPFGTTKVMSGAAATSTTTGAFDVAGGAGIAGALYVGGGETLTGTMLTQAAANYQISMSYNNASGDGFGVIQASHAGVANTPLQLNPNGGQVTVGGGGLAASGPASATTLTATSSPTSAPSGTVKGTICADSNGALYVKTTTGACL